MTKHRPLPASPVTLPTLLAAALLCVESAEAQCSFEPLGSGVTTTSPAVAGAVYASKAWSEGQGLVWIAGGDFWNAGGSPANNIARWNGQSWSPLGLGTNGAVRALQPFHDGSSQQLYVGGQFFSAGGLNSSGNLARWNGSQWSTLPGGRPNGDVYSLAAFNDGSGPALFASGDFTQAGGQPASRIARWNGTSWSALGAGLNSRAWDMQVFDDGTGEALYVGGDFTTVNGVAAKLVARWSNGTWTPLGGSLSGSAVRAFEVYNGELYAAGNIRPLNDIPIGNFVHRWNGQGWEPVGGRIDNTTNALAVVDILGGPKLFAGGQFETIGDVSMPRVARWNGADWVSLGQSSSQQPFVGVTSLGGYASGGNSSLMIGGPFGTWNGFSAKGVVAFTCPNSSTPPLVTVPGCFSNPATLVANSAAVAVGQPFASTITAAGFADGVSQLYVGAQGTDGAGCGLFLPTLGELLLALAPAPAVVAGGPLTAGSRVFAVAVPNTPSLVGAALGLQAVAVGITTPGFPAEFTNGLFAVVQP